MVRGHFSRLPHGFRLTLELIDVRKMSEIGYADIDRPDGNLAALQDDAVERMGRLLNVSVDKSARGDEAGASGSSYNDYVHALGYLERYDNNLGIFYDRTGRHREAVENYRHALDLTPDNAFVVLNLGGAYIDSNDPSLYPQAEKVLRRSIELNPTFDAYTNLGNLYLLERRYPESVQASEKALTMNAQNYNVWSNLLWACEQMGNQQRAAEARKQIHDLAEAAIRLNEKNADAHSMLAMVMAKEKDKNPHSPIFAPRSPCSLKTRASAPRSPRPTSHW